MTPAEPKAAVSEPLGRGRSGTRNLEFLVIGAARSGTTSLWRALDSHPQICVPSDKEREFFSSDARYEMGIDEYVARTFESATDDQILGTVTPQLMPPHPRTLDKVVDRIATTCPDVKLLAVLRDPIERAVSQFRRMKKIARGKDEDFEAFMRRMAEKRGGLGKIPLVQAGDYGRILRAYLAKFDRDQVKVFFTEDLDREPDLFYRRVFEFLGVNASHATGSPRIHVGGTTQRVTAEALNELLEELDRSGVWSDSNNAKRGFAWWLRHIWNCEPDQLGMEMSADLRRELSARYLADAEVFEKCLGFEPPWVSRLRGGLE